MLKNIIFDFGDVFINLDKQAMASELEKLNLKLVQSKILADINDQFEIGAISVAEFVKELNVLFPSLNHTEIIRIWNAILLDFPEHRLLFLEDLAGTKKYRLFLLSNTNALHITKVIQIMGAERFNRFKACFEQFYLSHEIGLRKPNADCYEFVLQENKLIAEETLFVDDTELNTEAAGKLGIQVWHLQVGKEDVTELKSRL